MARPQKTGYDLSRQWFDFAFEKSECKVQHTALYMWIIELNNRLGWKTQFGLPTNDTMEGLSMTNKNVYLKTLQEIQEWGFIRIVQAAKNQYQACIISLCHIKYDTAQHTALDTALIQQRTQHSDSTVYDIASGIDTIDKPRNKETKKQGNKDDEKENSSLPSIEKQVEDFKKREKENLEAEKIKNPPVLRAAPLSMDEYEVKFENDRSLLEAACITRKVTEPEYREALRDFFLEKGAVEHVPISEKDIKQHFLNWLKFWKGNQAMMDRDDGKGKIARGKDVTNNATDRILQKLNNGYFNSAD